MRAPPGTSIPRRAATTVASLASPLLLLLLAASAPSSIYAHRRLTTRPSCGSDYGSSSSALPVADPTISWSFKHYADCSSRAVWARLVNPRDGFRVYVGVGVPTLTRFEDLRADALIVGPGLPKLTEEEAAALPAKVANDEVWEGGDVGAILHRGPEDLSNCDFLGEVMSEASTVKDDRCDYYEPFGKTNSWRVLDADGNVLPVGGGTYHVAVWLREHTSGKIGVALGTWVENFFMDIPIDTPSCTADLDDFTEKDGDRSEDFPFYQCSSEASGPTDAVAAPEEAEEEEEEVCELGRVCPDDAEGCEIGGTAYVRPTMGACGGERCPAAVKSWEDVNTKMHAGMMGIAYTGDAAVDFVRGMIPHHVGAVDMCRVLVEDLTCAGASDVDALDGLVQFCAHLELKQEWEIEGMRRWLREKGFEETASCASSQMRGASAVMMMQGCGDIAAPSSAKFVEANHDMHMAMAIEYSCDHSIDFTRMMMPHHAGGVAMCEVVTEFTDDSYIMDLCANVTTVQRSEIAWMYEWLDSREHSAIASCADCGDATPADMEAPCEDILPSSGFCHLPGGLALCSCEEALERYPCGSTSYIDGVGTFVASEECQRSCGGCPAERPPLFHDPCGVHQDHTGGSDHDHHGHMQSDGEGEDDHGDQGNTQDHGEGGSEHRDHDHMKSEEGDEASEMDMETVVESTSGVIGQGYEKYGILTTVTFILSMVGMFV